MRAAGDIEIDGHHTVEDIGLVLGNAFEQALGDRAGIVRYGSATLPMDEVLVTVAVDFCGRPAFVWNVAGLEGKWIGDFDCELAKEFFAAFATRAQCNLHVLRPLRRQRAPHDRVHLQGVRARVRRGDADRSAPRRCGAVDQGYAHAT